MQAKRRPGADEREDLILSPTAPSNIAEQLRPLARPLDSLTLLRGNPRRGDIDAVARSYERFGQRKPIVARPDGTVIAGNHQLEAARLLGWGEIAVVVIDDDDATAKAFALADNRTSDLGTYDDALLSALLAEVAVDPELLTATGWTLDDMAASAASSGTTPVVDSVASLEVPSAAITRRGDIWLLGPHRLMCGDSTSAADVANLMNGAKATLVHADPPYGMGKEKDGIANDNLHAGKLDAFQMSWWRTFRPHVADNASAYIWGTPDDLWRLWYCGGLNDSERLTFRNEIVWDKGSGMGQKSDEMRGFAISTERCLFFVLGAQGFNINADNYWHGWEPIRSYLADEMRRCGWTPADLNRITGTQMAGHWVTTSQWAFITAEHYAKIQKAAREHEAFKREHEAFKREHEALKREHERIRQDFYATRAHFDNTHDNMNEVWQFERVYGDERFGHATPKPLSMIERAIRSAAPEGALVVEPFAGTGTTLIAAATTGRLCYTMELEENYCDTVCARFLKATGITPILESTGEPFAPAD